MLNLLCMMRRMYWISVFLLLSGAALGATKPHTVSFGKWITVKWLAGRDESKPLDLKVRPLFVDGRAKEFTAGTPHEITERLFVVRRAFRLNDTLPDDKTPEARWHWERGGWLLVDRVTMRISPIYLPEFDTYSSVASWYRDYVAYCGVSDDGNKLFFLVARLGRRKPVLKKLIRPTPPTDEPDSACPAPNWERQPTRVTFILNGEEKSTYEVRGHAVDLVRDEPEDEAGTE